MLRPGDVLSHHHMCAVEERGLQQGMTFWGGHNRPKLRGTMPGASYRPEPDFIDIFPAHQPVSSRLYRIQSARSD